jgi:restriction endonuclease Mrr
VATTHRFHSRKPACQWDFLFLVYQTTARTITKDWIEYIPKFHQTFLPILKVLASREQMHYRELVSQVISISFGDLPAESLKLKTKSGTNVLADRIGWGKPYLKQAKMIKYPVRGQVKITSKGLEILNQVDLTLKELSNDPDYLACQDSKSEKRSTKSMKQRRINHMIYQTKKKLTLLLS